MVEAPLRCAAHPDVETRLRCGKCGKPICPQCMVQTPVGARCRDCARVRRIPTYEISGLYLLRAIGAGLGVAAASGLVWGLIRNFTLFGYFNILLALGVAWAVAEVLSVAVNRRRGSTLATIGALSVAVSYFLSYSFWSWGLHNVFNLWGILALVLGIVLVVSRLR